MHLAIETGVAFLVPRLVCRGMWIAMHGLDYTIYAAIVGGFACLQGLELVTITMCFPISLACFIVVLFKVTIIESLVGLFDFLGLRRHHAQYLSRCLGRFQRPGPIICSVVFAAGWIQQVLAVCGEAVGASADIVAGDSTASAHTAGIMQFTAVQAISAVVMLASLFTDSVHFASRGDCQVASALLVWGVLPTTTDNYCKCIAMCLAIMWPSLPDDQSADDPEEHNPFGFGLSQGDDNLWQSQAPDSLVEDSMPPPPAPKRRRILGKQPTNEMVNSVVGDSSIASFFTRILNRSNETCRDTTKDVATGDGTIIDDINEHLDTIRKKNQDGQSMSYDSQLQC